MSNRILIVGSVATDDITTPTASVTRILGGAAVYGSIIASRFAPVDIVGVCGDDFPKQHLETLHKHGINTDGLEIIPGGKTFHWGGEYQGDMNMAKTHFTELGVFAEFSPKIPESYRDNDFVFLANIDPELQLDVVKQVRKPKLIICDTMNYWIKHKRDVVVDVLSKVDVAVINDAEACELFNTPSLPRAAHELLELGLKRAIIKKGSNGAQMFSRESIFAVPALPLSIVRDPTGAGDTFAGGLMGYLAKTGTLDDMAFRQAIMIGSACASHVVEDFSIRRTAGLSMKAIQERVDKLQAAIHCEAIKL